MSTPAPEQHWDGLFGPDTVTWRVHSEPILWVAGLRALLLQALHPAALSGVLVHSDFRADPWGRLLRTAEYVGTVSFGTGEDVARVAGRVRALHGKVAGADPKTGVHYRADDPQLLTWVHCCEVDSFLRVTQRAGLKLTAAEADRYVSEQVRAAELLGCRRGVVPASVGELAAYFTEMRRELRADSRARRIAAYVLWPPMPTWVSLLTPARPLWAGASSLGLTTLPRWARRLYGLPGLPGTDLMATAELRALRVASSRLPASVREGPHLRAAKDRLGTSR
ncbi:MAG: hypothetical protein QOE64_2807 [Frankiales bacterium]|nr:hypothetical protein [Frankiales bacterium]